MVRSKHGRHELVQAYPSLQRAGWLGWPTLGLRIRRRVSSILLASFEYSNPTVASHMVQILVVVCAVPVVRDPDDAAHVPCGARVEQS